MASGGSGPGDVFDVRKVRRLVELMNEHDLAEIDLRQADQRIRLRRGQEPTVAMAGYQAPTPQVLPAAHAPPQAATGNTADLPAGEEPSGLYVTSPMVGTFFSASSPDAPSFVKVGDQIGEETVVCIIEAMKVFNEIPAECSGKIIAALVENGAAVEFGQKLFKVEPTS